MPALKKADIKARRRRPERSSRPVSLAPSRLRRPSLLRWQKPGEGQADPLRGPVRADGGTARRQSSSMEPRLRAPQHEQVPLWKDGGIEALHPPRGPAYTPDAWIKEDATKIGYEVSLHTALLQTAATGTLDRDSADNPRHRERRRGMLDGLLKGSCQWKATEAKLLSFPAEIAAIHHPDLPAHLLMDRQKCLHLGRHPAPAGSSEPITGPLHRSHRLCGAGAVAGHTPSALARDSTVSNADHGVASDGSVGSRAR